jgi:hypothetical protein
VGKLGECGEYQMGRLRVESFYVQSSEGGSPHPSRLRKYRLALVGKFDCVLGHTIFMGSYKLSVWVSHRCPSRYHAEDRP